MLQALQKLYAMQRPTRIEYADESGRFLTVSQAHATGALRDSRLHVIYENGLEIWVNGSKEVWKVGVFGKIYELPPWGWCAVHRKSGFLEFSAIVDGRRADHVSSREYEYVDGRGAEQSGRFLVAAGAAVWRKTSDGKVEILDIYGNDRIGIRALGGLENCAAYDGSGASMGYAEIRKDRDTIWIKCIKGARRYVLEPKSNPD